MAGTVEGSLKRIAAWAGVSPDEYQRRLAAGERPCTICKEWKPTAEFDRDRSRPDGVARRCITCSRVKERVCTKGRASTFKGRTHTAEAKAAMSAKRVGKPGPRKGGRRTPEERAMISAAVRASPRLRRGRDCHSYVDGKAAERLNLHAAAEVKRWRFDVYVRDRFTCQDCGDARGRNLHAHHIKPFATHPELRTELSNGVTLCKTCHKARHASGNL